MINTVLLDFDGTIMDTNEVIIQSWQETYRQLQGREEKREVILKTFGEPLEYSMKNVFPEVPAEKSVGIYREYQRMNFLGSIELFPGIRELLDELLARDYAMALVTSRLKYTVNQALDQFDLRKYFKTVVTADDVTRHKPDPQCVEIVLNQMNADPKYTLMVGDTIHDMQCAHNANIMPVLVSWSITLGGKKISDFEKKQAPAHILSEPRQLLEILG